MHRIHGSLVWCGWIVFGLASSTPACGDTVTLGPVADTSLIEASPDNNLGGESFAPAGVTQNRTRAHALFRFEVTAQIPPHSTVRSVALILQITGQPKDGYTPAAFDLHRVLKPWGEGTNTAEFSNHPGMGAPATTNEATWNNRLALTPNAWTLPGGAPTNDYSPVISAQQFVYDIGNSPYTFGPTAQLTLDVQAWVDHPETNFGWLLMANDETANFTARRFATREDTNNAPQLLVDFVPPLRLTAPQLGSNGFAFSFPASPGGAYSVDYRNTLLTGDWIRLTNIVAPMATHLTVFDLLSAPQRFYRVTTTNAPGP